MSTSGKVAWSSAGLLEHQTTVAVDFRTDTELIQPTTLIFKLKIKMDTHIVEYKLREFTDSQPS